MTARSIQPTDTGDFLDVAPEIVFCDATPLAFAVANTTTNALPAVVLLEPLSAKLPQLLLG